jgi:uncharacterized membrane protein YoaK (UPF0700 family)
MPIPFLQRLAGRERTRRSNRQLGGVLAFVAGAINAGGFLAVQRYTSHMSGIVSALADDLAVGSVALALAGLASLLAFVAGAVTTTVLISWARRRELQSKYALALMLEALLLLLFGVAGANLHNFAQLLVPSTVLLLCFIMGLQNAIVTKISHAEIRTTHMTGVITDLGIELGRLLYWNRSADTPQRPAVVANRDKLATLATLLALFFGGGLLGALMFKHLGYAATVPFALGLALLAAPAVWLDVQTHRHHA